LIYKAVSSWFVSIDKVKETMIAANQKVSWYPEHIKNGRFGKWLEGARDWAISRNRYWGSPIPVWKCPDCGETICVGSIQELYELSGVKLDDLHKHFVDKVTIPCKCGSKMHRVDEVLDCWFESGSMPYAQNHYPFENKEAFDATFPADFIAEGLDQTRGWFYTLTVLGAALFGQSPMKNVVVNGLVLAEDGRKMSKRLKNYPEVDYVFDKYGADALRLFLMNSAAIKAGELLFSEKGVEDVIKRYHLPLWNTYSFFVTYAKVDNWNPKEQDNNYKNPLDIWLQSYTEKLATDCDKALGEYDFQTAIRSLYDYIDNLTNWYVRRSRRRFWKSEDDMDKKQAYTALYNALITFCKAAAPIAPFLSEKIYDALRTEDMPESVHLCDYPTGDASKRDLTVEREMELVQRVVEMGRSLRAKVGINLRKPLNAVYLITRNQEEMELMRKMESIVKEELNVKNVVYETEEEKLVSLSCKANFRVLGKKAGKSMKAVAAVIAGFGAKEATMIETGTPVTVEADGNTFELTAEDVIIDRKEKEGLTVQNEGTLTIALDTNLTQELIDEGIAREFIRAVQNLRKERNFDVTDRIKIVYEASEKINAAVDKNESIIKNETLAVEIVKATPENIATADVDEENIKLDVVKA
jgi:isoleucyl-tRNA synthetase